jgi:glycosyltransferase involved in cell wall biosynthesis
MDKEAARKRLGLSSHQFYLSFGAANVEDERKGLSYLLEALQIFANSVNDTESIALLVFGKAKPALFDTLPFHVKIMGNIDSNSGTLLDVYNASDVFILPSLQDNFPNTLLEAAACGIPCLAFDTGGIPEMIDHQITGYLARYKNSQSLAEGIQYLYKHADPQSLADKARQKAMECSYPTIAGKYCAVYQELL